MLVSMAEKRVLEEKKGKMSATSEWRIADAEMRRQYNCPTRWSIRDKQWIPKMTTLQDEAMKSMARAWAGHKAGQQRSPCPFWGIDRRVLASLGKRGWVEKKLPILTPLGQAVVLKFWPGYLE